MSDQIKRIVLFKFQPQTSEAEINRILGELGGLKAKIEGVVDFVAGKYDSADALNKDYTHAFIMTYRDRVARDGFGPHPAHQAVVAGLKDHVADVLAFDFSA